MEAVECCPALSFTFPVATGTGADGCSLVPALDLASESQLTLERNWASGITDWLGPFILVGANQGSSPLSWVEIIFLERKEEKVTHW